MSKTYVVLRPQTPGNTTSKHLVVDTDEYVDVSRHGKEAYDNVTEHDDYDSASADRDKFNKEPQPCTPTSTPEPSQEIPPQQKPQVLWKKPTASPSTAR
jgi:hypothetical protein